MIEVTSGPRLLAGRYVLDRELGRGGMAVVYEGHDRRLDRRVAVKTVPVEATETTARQRFVREARSTARLSHPNAVAVFDAGETDGNLYIVMEFVEGRTLADELAERERLEPDRARTIAVSVLAALGHAHRAGLVHRDVKPSNIMLSNDGTVKLLDFGIARRLDDLAGATTQAGGLIGTPKYLAPEQVEGRPATPASDLYAVGVVLFEMLTGAPPFDRESLIATALAHAVAPVPDVSSVRVDLPATLAAAIDKALAKNPADRFTTAEEMSDAVTDTPNPATVVERSPEPTTRMLPPPEPPRMVRDTDHTATLRSTHIPDPTEVLTPDAYRRRRPAGWWLLGVAAISVVAGVLIWSIQNNDREETAASPTTTAPPTTTAIPTTIDGVIAALRANPDAYGPHTNQIIDELAAIQQGDNPNQRAAALLEQVTTWVNAGEATAATFSMLESVLAPLLESASADDNDNDDGNGSGGGNGNGNGNGGGNGNGNGNGNGRGKKDD